MLRISGIPTAGIPKRRFIFLSRILLAQETALRPHFLCKPCFRQTALPMSVPRDSKRFGAGDFKKRSIGTLGVPKRQASSGGLKSFLMDWKGRLRLFFKGKSIHRSLTIHRKMKPYNPPQDDPWGFQKGIHRDPRSPAPDDIGEEPRGGVPALEPTRLLSMLRPS